MYGTNPLAATLLQSGGGIIPKGSRDFVFQQIFQLFLLLGTLVGIVVISYMLYNAYKYREGSGNGEDADVERPQLGEIPQGSGGGRKLFLSFAMSAIIVISLIAWAYGILLFVEQGAAQQPTVDQAQEPLEVDVVGYQFGWEFTYANGKTVRGTANDPFRVPADRRIELNVTSRDVMHNFGIPGLRVKTDAIPGQYTETWFLAEEPGNTYTARCYELCGTGHSIMTAKVETMEQSAFQDWYRGNQTANGTASA